MSIIISTTTIPSRVKYLKRSVSSLVSQGMPVYVWLPKHVERIGKGFDSVPGFLKKMDVTANIVDDLGPATKMLYAFDLAETVITGDDDREYGDGWARGFVEWAEKRPDAALGYRGRKLTKGFNYGKTKLIKNPDEPVEVDIITSVDGALYHRRHFDDTIYDECEGWRENDDILFGGHLHQRDVPRLVIPRHCKINPTDAHGVDALFARHKVAKLYSKGLERLYG